MSLINQMLKDLEKRSRATPTPDTALLGLQSVIAPSFEHDKKYYLFVAIASLIMAAVLIPWIIHKHTLKNTAQANILTEPQKQELTPTTAKPINATEQSAPSKLTGATLQVQPNQTNLRLLLNQNTLYKITAGANEQEVALTLENTQIVSSLPPVNYDGSAIQNIQTKNDSNGDLTITLFLNPGAHINHLDIMQGTHSPELQIDIDYKTTVARAEPLEINEPEVQALNVKKAVLGANVQEQYQHALSLASAGSHTESIQSLKEIVADFPTYIPAKESLIGMQMQYGNKQEAENLLDNVLRQQPDSPSFLQLKARLMIDKGKVDAALSLLQNAAPPMQSNPDYHALMAALYQRQGQPAMAAQMYQQLLSIQPRNSKWWIGLGIALENTGKPSEAQYAYSKAETSGQLSPELRAYIATRMQNSPSTTG